MRVRVIASLAWLAALLACAIAGALGAAAPVRPGSYRDGVLAVLRSRNIDPAALVVQDGCAPSLERCRSYAGAVTIVADTTMRGRIDCRERWTGCALTVPAARIDAAPLPDVFSPYSWRLAQLRGELVGWLRGLGRR